MCNVYIFMYKCFVYKLGLFFSSSIPFLCCSLYFVLARCTLVVCITILISLSLKVALDTAALSCGKPSTLIALCSRHPPSIASSHYADGLRESDCSLNFNSDMAAVVVTV